jgi:hypothetical protein
MAAKVFLFDRLLSSYSLETAVAGREPREMVVDIPIPIRAASLQPRLTPQIAGQPEPLSVTLSI